MLTRNIQTILHTSLWKNPTTIRRFSSTIQQMTASQFSEILNDDIHSNNYQIVDVREEDELRMMSIDTKGLIHLPLSKANEWQSKLSQSDILTTEKPVICMCHAGVRSMRFAQYLSGLGFTDVFNLEGGISKFASEFNTSVKKG
mmetsp:Transcript_25471/g.37572  ORF Transcript_25471/g.37572 Transcript_25471/m.37572 type:complete len:144 (-) Transcript_25471:229-660(-)